MQFISFVVLILSIAIEISQGVIFDSSFSDQVWSYIGTRYTCTPKISSSSLILEDVRGNHLAGKTNLDVEFLDISQQDLTYIPKGIEKFFTNLKGIRYVHSNLATISSDDLKPFSQLLFFGVYDAKLVSLPGNLFQYNLNLQVVSFFANKIEHIGSNLLGGLRQLKDVSFLSNVCINKYARSLEEIKQLNEELPILCPPKIDELLLCKNEIEKANKRISELEMTIRVLASTC